MRFQFQVSFPKSLFKVRWDISLILNINGLQRQTQSYLVALCSLPILLGVARVMNKLGMTEWMRSCVQFRAQKPRELVPGHV